MPQGGELRSPTRKPNLKAIASAGSGSVCTAPMASAVADTSSSCHDPVVSRILERLNIIEAAGMSSVARTDGQAETVTKIRCLENAINSLQLNMTTLRKDNHETIRAITKLENQLSRHETKLDNIQSEVDSRRSVIAMMDGWARQAELWREEMEGQMFTMKNRLQELLPEQECNANDPEDDDEKEEKPSQKDFLGNIQQIAEQPKRLSMSQKHAEKQMDSLVMKVDEFAEALQHFEEQASSMESGLRIDFRALERRVEQCVAIAGNSLSAVQGRCQGLEETVRTCELVQRDHIGTLKDEIMGHVAEAKEAAAEDRLALDRRLVVVEGISEDVLEQSKLSSSTVESFFACSPHVQRFETAAAKLEGIRFDVKALQAESKDLQQTVTVMESSCAPRADVTELRLQIARYELLVQQHPTTVSALKTNEDKIHRFQEMVVAMQLEQKNFATESRYLGDKVTSSDALIAQMQTVVSRGKEASDEFEERFRVVEERNAQAINVLQERSEHLLNEMPVFNARIHSLEISLNAVNESMMAASKLEDDINDIYATLSGVTDTMKISKDCQREADEVIHELTDKVNHLYHLHHLASASASKAEKENFSHQGAALLSRGDGYQEADTMKDSTNRNVHDSASYYHSTEDDRVDHQTKYVAPGAMYISRDMNDNNNGGSDVGDPMGSDEENGSLQDHSTVSITHRRDGVMTANEGGNANDDGDGDGDGDGGDDSEAIGQPVDEHHVSPVHTEHDPMNHGVRQFRDGQRDTLRKHVNSSISVDNLQRKTSFLTSMSDSDDMAESDEKSGSSTTSSSSFVSEVVIRKKEKSAPAGSRIVQASNSDLIHEVASSRDLVHEETSSSSDLVYEEASSSPVGYVRPDPIEAPVIGSRDFDKETLDVSDFDESFDTEEVSERGSSSENVPLKFRSNSGRDRKDASNSATVITVPSSIQNASTTRSFLADEKHKRIEKDSDEDSSENEGSFAERPLEVDSDGNKHMNRNISSQKNENGPSLRPVMRAPRGRVEVQRTTQDDMYASSASSASSSIESSPRPRHTVPTVPTPAATSKRVGSRADNTGRSFASVRTVVNVMRDDVSDRSDDSDD
jgi:hypothetical protein